MALARVQLDQSGIAAILRSAEMVAAVHSVAAQVAANVASQGLVAHSAGRQSSSAIEAVVEDIITDRAHSTVLIDHPAAVAMQQKHGVLTRAAAAAGLEVHS